MPWIDLLQGVAAIYILMRRDEIATLMCKAGELRTKAYFQSCALESEAKGKWSAEEIAQAKHRAGW